MLDDLACTGTETSLFDCIHGGLNMHNCAHSEDVGVICACELYFFPMFVNSDYTLSFLSRKL